MTTAVSGPGFMGKPLLIQRTPGGATEIVYKQIRFLITERPNDLGMNSYLEDLKKFNVSMVVRVCEATYEVEKLLKEGIAVKDLEFPDGQPPPQEVIDAWLELVRSGFSADPTTCIAVHCVAGLGRAPVLVALALMELGMKYEDAVELIRAKRRGAVNSKQLSFLQRYKPKSRLKSSSKINNNNNNNNCVVM
ncbi:protein tyrosine phosphatase type IVA 1 [Folsomia candida]|uniref:protein tyrosine phosphatase type IVA 1 n=1 Tax=Folsomia candida TaxID=158441 RepID=UPI000B902C7F|nr:protein tyrosine phosphatase type IVA 1 [Folsomia candida]